MRYIIYLIDNKTDNMDSWNRNNRYTVRKAKKAVPITQAFKRSTRNANGKGALTLDSCLQLNDDCIYEKLPFAVCR